MIQLTDHTSRAPARNKEIDRYTHARRTHTTTRDTQRHTTRDTEDAEETPNALRCGIFVVAGWLFATRGARSQELEPNGTERNNAAKSRRK